MRKQTSPSEAGWIDIIGWGDIIDGGDKQGPTP